jgi:hypothetical protein
LQLAQDRGLLRIDDGVWHCADAKTLSTELSRGHVLHRRLEELERRSFEHLLVLAVAGTPLDARTVAGAMGRADEGVEAELGALERRGFVVRTGRRWEPAHHNIIEAVTQMASAGAMPAIHSALGRALAAFEDAEAGTLARAARHLAVGGAEVDLARVFDRWLEVTVGRRERTRLTERAEWLLGEQATPERVRRLVASVPWRRRLRASGRLWPVAAAAAAAVLLGILVPLAPRLLGNAAPSRLVLIGAPIAVVPGTSQLLPAPTVEVRGASGAVDSTAAVVVTAELAAGSGVLSGTVSLPADQGRATFDDLRLEGTRPGTFVLRFTAPGLDPVLSREFVLVNEDEGSTLRLVGGVLSGQRVSPQRRRVVVGPGELIEGDVDLVYTSRWGAASVMLGSTVTWGDTPALEMPRRVAVRVVAPDQPGSYRLIFAFFAETSVEEIMSGTNWTVGRPVWGDGNDVARWSTEQLAQADSIGRVRTKMLRGGKWAFVWVQATTIEIVVREPLTPSSRGGSVR